MIRKEIHIWVLVCPSVRAIMSYTSFTNTGDRTVHIDTIQHIKEAIEDFGEPMDRGAATPALRNLFDMEKTTKIVTFPVCNDKRCENSFNTKYRNNVSIIHLRWRCLRCSYAVHNDMRNHTGGGLSMGRGLIHSKSSKQNLNTKSSTESEVATPSLKLSEPVIIYRISSGRKTLWQRKVSSSSGIFSIKTINQPWD